MKGCCPSSRMELDVTSVKWSAKDVSYREILFFVGVTAENLYTNTKYVKIPRNSSSDFKRMRFSSH